jgi:hypothetical protein
MAAHNSYTRLPAILNLAPEMRREDWLTLLGSHWTICDNIGLYQDDLRGLLDPCVMSPEMMTQDELERWHQLPDVVQIFRGAGEETLDGISWTLERPIAAGFPINYRYKPLGKPMIAHAKVNRTDIIAVKLDRKEAEIITFRAEILERRRLKVGK